jgi:hypothetical protein
VIFYAHVHIFTTVGIGNKITSILLNICYIYRKVE